MAESTVHGNQGEDVANGAKAQAWRRIRAHSEILAELARRILANPELGYAEQRASHWLAEELAALGFRIEQPCGGLATAFRASWTALGNDGEKRPGPKIAFLAEYDALPEIGHGCGHNLIGPAAVGAALGVQSVLDNYGGAVHVIGTPAEEFLGEEEGKLKLLRAGVFNGIDAMLMTHPHTEHNVVESDLGFVACDVVFHGRTAHASADPWNGLNALDGILLTFNAVNALRQQLRPEVRIHRVITEGGQAPNIVPERAAARFMVRAADPNTLEATYARFAACALGAAEASGTTLALERTTTVYNSRLNRTLNRLIRENFEALGEALPEAACRMSGSSDFGNVTQMIPGAMFTIGTHAPGTRWHSSDVHDAAASPHALNSMIAGACVLAGVALDMYSSQATLRQVREDFENR